ncbi:ABC transporter permease subunit [bacterium]|nr:ABC transporter permease subunit [bacterium]
MKIITIAQNTFREAIRSKVLFTVFFFVALLIAIAAVFGSVSIGDHAKVVKDFGLFSISFFGAVVAIISGVSLLNKELKQKTIYNILSKPVTRLEFIVGKFLGLAFTTSIIIMLMGACVMTLTFFIEGKWDLLFLQGIFMTILEIIVICAVTMFFSSLVVTTILSGLFTFAAYLGGRGIEYINYFFTSGEFTRPELIPMAKLFRTILPHLNNFNFADRLVYGHPISAPEATWAVVYCLSYSMIVLILAAFIFDTREFN